MSRTAVYTAITDGYNELQPHPEIPGVEWIAFTDTSIRSRADWEIRHIEPLGFAPRRVAKYYKMRPDLALPEYDCTIWIDGTVRVDSPTITEALDWTAGSGVAMFRHPERTDIWDEADVSLEMPKYQAEPIALQVEHYLDQGFPRYAGLWCGGIIARENTELVRKLGEMWLAEVDRWSIQDQISLPFVLRELGITPGAFPGSLYSNPWLSITGHNPER